MPFTGSARDYIGGQLIAQGVSQGVGALSDALQRYEEDKARAAMSDITLDYAKNIPGAITPEALQRYHQSNAKEKAYIAMGVQANLKDMLERTQQDWQNRMYAAHANYYQTQAGKENEPFGPKTFVVKDPVTGQDRSYISTSKGQVQAMNPKPDDQLEYDEEGNAIGRWSNGRFIKFPAPPDPLKAAIAEQMKPEGGAPKQQAPAKAAAPAGTTAAPVHVGSVAEALKLPAGTLFIDPQGVTRRR